MVAVTLLLERDAVIDNSNRVHIIKAFRTLTGLDLLKAVRTMDGAIAIGYSTTATDRRDNGATVGVHPLKYNDVVYGHVSILERN